nr:uncharacterized protein LOC120367907 [Saimiri boliviensis boliviensis]
MWPPAWGGRGGQRGCRRMSASRAGTLRQVGKHAACSGGAAPAVTGRCHPGHPGLTWAPRTDVAPRPAQPPSRRPCPRPPRTQSPLRGRMAAAALTPYWWNPSLKSCYGSRGAAGIKLGVPLTPVSLDHHL